jgi:hypothetical protein
MPTRLREENRPDKDWRRGDPEQTHLNWVTPVSDAQMFDKVCSEAAGLGHSTPKIHFGQSKKSNFSSPLSDSVRFGILSRSLWLNNICSSVAKIIKHTLQQAF